MEIFLNLFIPVLTFAIAYFFGSIPCSVWLGKIFYNKDIRNEGSGNPGGTNATRVLGKKAGFLVIFLDVFKGAIVFWITWIILRFTSLSTLMSHDAKQIAQWIIPFAAVFGHCYSMFLKFNGGKGVSTFAGSTCCASWSFFIFEALVFFCTLGIKRIVSLASIIGVSLTATYSWVLCGLYYGGYSSIVNYLLLTSSDILEFHRMIPLSITLMAIMVIIRHKDNIKRLINKEERKIGSKVEN